MKTKIIPISGKAGSGKDTFGSMLEKGLKSRGYRVLVTHYADYLKYICKNYFGWDGKKDEKGRALIQHVGTDIVRKQYPDFWVKTLAETVSLLDSWDYVIVPDARFPNEIEVLTADYGGFFDVYSIRVTRENYESKLAAEQQAHESETSLDDYEFDIYVNNTSFTSLWTDADKIAAYLASK